VVAAASALLTYHLGGQLPSSSSSSVRRRVRDDQRRAAIQRDRRRAPAATRPSVDVRRVLEGLDMEDRRDPANVDETDWNERDDESDSANDKVGIDQEFEFYEFFFIFKI